MKFCIITQVSHGILGEKYFAYEPYIREMNIWLKYCDDLFIIAPLNLENFSTISSFYESRNTNFYQVPSFNFIKVSTAIKSIFILPKICFIMYKVMKKADHIHLRCPGNMGLLGCIMQLFFPSKIKTAKYAGNWDPKSKQPLSYKLQKWILSNTFLTKNMQVLVYGDWNTKSKKIKPFFTASYNESEIFEIENKPLSQPLKFLFVGTLSHGKQPIYSVKLVHEVLKNYPDATLELIGEGIERESLRKYIVENKLEKNIFLLGNLNKEELKLKYQQSHFLILPSKSEGWPKVIAEAMIWKCLPISTPVSGVSNMLDNGNRGLILSLNLVFDAKMIFNLISNQENYFEMNTKAFNWSKQFTTNFFESEIKLLLQKN